MTGCDSVDAVPLRFATREDVPAVLALLRGLHAETPHAPLSEARLRATVGAVLAGGSIILTMAGDDPVGTCGLMVEAPWFSDAPWVRDVWLYVHPDHRRTPHARALIRCAKRYAAALPAPLQMEVAGGPAAGSVRRVAAKMRLYRRELGEPTGATWVVKEA
jgi:GNAT superfamily N-acetyltransferase